MLRLLTLWLCVAGSLACNPTQLWTPAPATSISQGKLRGTWLTTRAGRQVAAFLGVPYAAPPVGSLRFKSAVEPKPWKGVYQANGDASGCVQPSPRVITKLLPFLPDSYGNENCLYLNIITPSITLKTKLPVVVFIHGGYFETGFGTTLLHGPDYLLDEDVVLVTINYRLGILGFLSLEHSALPGNLGLKDQRAALRWVRDNIAQFGGDPRAVTLFGESAGAASVHYHIMFTAHEGLFRAAICNSGSALAPWALQNKESRKSLIQLLVQETGCPDMPDQLVECLRQLTANELQELLQLARRTSSKLLYHVSRVGPVVEHRNWDRDVLVTADPWNTSTRLPLLIGGNQMEGLYWLVDIEKDQTDKMFEEFDANYSSILPFNLFFKESTDDLAQVAASLKKFYFKNEHINRKHYTNLVDMYSDALFNYDLVEAARRNKDKTFFYQLNYMGSNSVVHYLGSKENYGVSHYDDMFFFFPIGGTLFRNVSETDVFVSKQMVKMWTNFIKYLDPTPDGFPVKWEAVSSPEIEFLNIGQHEMHMQTGFLTDRINFWKTLSFTNKKHAGKKRQSDSSGRFVPQE